VIFPLQQSEGFSQVGSKLKDCFRFLAKHYFCLFQLQLVLDCRELKLRLSKCVFENGDKFNNFQCAICAHFLLTQEIVFSHEIMICDLAGFFPSSLGIFLCVGA